MSRFQYETLRAHVGHSIVCVNYGDGDNIAIECEDCGVVLTSENREDDAPDLVSLIQNLRPMVDDESIMERYSEEINAVLDAAGIQ